MNEKISVIVPIYGTEDVLDEAIESLVNQTYKNLEIILVNDGSPDQSDKICHEWEKKDSRIKVIEKENGGLSSARNAGLKLVTGNYIGFFDSDDILEPQMYEWLLEDIHKYNVDIAMCNSRRFSEKGYKDNGYYCPSSIISGQDCVTGFFKYNKLFNSSVWSKLYKKELFDGITFLENISPGEDYHVNGLMYTKINSMYYDERIMYNYRYREGSLTNQTVNKHFADKYKVAEKLGELLKDNDRISKEMIAGYKYSVSWEILYEIVSKKADNKMISRWKKILKRNFKEYSEVHYIPFKHKFSLCILASSPKLYYKLSKIQNRKKK